MRLRRDLALNAGINIVLLYEGDEFFLRILNRNSTPHSYLSRHMPVKVDDLRRFVRADDERLDVEADGWVVRAMGKQVYVAKAGADMASAFGSRAFFESRIKSLLREAELEEGS